MRNEDYMIILGAGVYSVGAEFICVECDEKRYPKREKET